MLGTSFKKVIDSFKVQFVGAEHKEVIKSVRIKNDTSDNNRLLILHKGKITIHEESQETALRSHSMFFLPAGANIDITYGTLPIATFYKTDADKNMGAYLRPLKLGVPPTGSNVFSVIEFNIKAYNAIEFFQFIGLPAFEIDSTSHMDELINNILEENFYDKLGKRQLIYSNMLGFMVVLIRYIIEQKIFLQDIALKIEALMDHRLIEIFSYVVDDIQSDLSNTSIAKKVGLSKDYVSQFFKKMTGRNLQDYVKELRMSKAVTLVKTTNMPIQEVCKAVGINDFSYFCRLFKKIMGVSAKKIQQRSRNKLSKKQ